MIVRLARSVFIGSLLFLCCFTTCLASGQANETSISRYSREAQQALAAKDLRGAAAALEKLAQLTPGSPEVHANLGMVYYTEGRYPEAAAGFQKAVRLDPKIPNGTLMLALCNAELGNWEQARPGLESGFQHPPSREIGRTIGIKLTEAYSALGQHFKALAVSEELMRLFPNDPEILYRASHMYGDRALETMTQLATVAPQSPWKILAFGEAMEAQKHYDLAIIQYRKVIAADPNLPGVHYRLGRALLLNGVDNEGASDEAMKEFQAALATDPRNADAEYEIGEILRRRGDSEQAAGHFMKAAEIDPHFEQAQIAVARILISRRKAKEALPYLAAAIKVNSNNEVSHYFLASAYKSLGDEAGAERETELYKECHARSLPATSSDPAPASVAVPAVTQQTVDSDAAATPNHPPL